MNGIILIGQKTVKRVPDGITVTMADINKSTFSSIAETDKDSSQFLTLQSLEISQNSSQTLKNSLLLFKISTFVFEARFIHIGADISLDFYDKRNGGIDENIHFLESAQSFFADGSFGVSKSDRLSVVPVRGEGGALWFA